MVISYLYYHNVICNQIFKICEDYSYSCSTEAVNITVLETLKDGVKYSDLVAIEKDNSGQITLMQTNSLKINMINREVADKTATLLKEKLHSGIPVPILAFSGVSFLSGYGSKVNVKTVNNVSVICNFNSKFTSVGINQTLHSIYVDVVSLVQLEVPLNNREKECKTSILISETVLVGKVPELYLNGGLFGK